MIRNTSSYSPWMLGLGLFHLALLSGCATQEAVSEQTEPLKAQVATLDQGLRQAAGATIQTQSELAAAREREMALTRKLEGLAGEARQFRADLMAQARRADEADGRSGIMAGDIKRLQVAADGLSAELAAIGRDAVHRLDTLGTRQDSLERVLAGLASRLEGVAARIEENTKAFEKLAAHQSEQAHASARQSEQIQGIASSAQALRTQLAKLEDQGAATRSAMDARAANLQEGLSSSQAADAGLSERIERADKRLEDVANRLAGVSEQGAALRQSFDAQAAALPARLARLEGRMDDLARLARSAMDMAAQMDIRSNGKVAFSVVLTDDKTLYPLNLQELARRDRESLEALVLRLKAMDKEYHLEIQGHTDNTSVDDYNYQLGKARAEVVKRYLHEQGGIPLGWMSVISYGATQPLDPKGTHNRRIVIQTLVLEKEK